MSGNEPPDRPAPRLGAVRAGPVLLVAGLIYLSVQLGTVLLLVFAAVLLGVALDGLASPLAARTPLSRGWALLLVCLVLLGLLGLVGALVVPQVLDQFRELWGLVADFIDAGEDAIMSGWTGDIVEGVDPDGDRMAGMVGDLLSYVASYGLTTAGALASVIVLVVLAVFLAANPALYRGGLLKLVPPARRPSIDRALTAVGQALRWWFLSQLVSMAILGTTVAIGLWVIGVELWLSLALITAILTFIPYLGPIIAGVPVLIVGFTEDVQTGLIVAAFYLFIQNLEGNVLVPLIQHKVAHLPPVLSIVAQVTLGLVFGIAGFILAAPLALAAMVLIQTLYLEDVLGEEA